MNKSAHFYLHSHRKTAFVFSFRLDVQRDHVHLMRNVSEAFSDLLLKTSFVVGVLFQT